MRIWRSWICGSPNVPPISRGNCQRALLSSRMSRGKYNGASTSYIPRSCDSKQRTIVSFLYLSKKRRIVPAKQMKKKKQSIYLFSLTSIRTRILNVFDVFIQNNNRYLRKAIWAPISGGKFFCTVDTTQIAIDFISSSRALHKIFLRKKQNETDKLKYESGRNASGIRNEQWMGLNK